MVLMMILKSAKLNKIQILWLPYENIISCTLGHYRGAQKERSCTKIAYLSTEVAFIKYFWIEPFVLVHEKTYMHHFGGAENYQLFDIIHSYTVVVI